MSYPAPPPPGGTGSPNPYQAPAGSAPYGGPPPKKKDNTLWWILGIIGGVIVLCCCAVGILGIWGLNEADDQISSYTSSVNSSDSSAAAQGVEVTRGGAGSVGGATIEPGWSVDSNDNITGLTVKNDSGSPAILSLTFYFLEDGQVIDDVSCTTDYLDEGESDSDVTCFSAIRDLDDADEIRVTEGY